MRVAGGQAEDGIVIGNTFDKYGSRNPIVQRMMKGFDDTLAGFVRAANPGTIHEVGCGEGYWVMRWASEGIDVKGSDFSAQVIDMAAQNAATRGLAHVNFEVRSIYDLEEDRDSADLVVCCEVLEHVEDPERALAAIQRVARRDVIISVPREPLWRVLNMARAKYIGSLGNTPGHVNHWSSRGIAELVGNYFDVVSVARPLPWTMIHCKPHA